MDGVWLPAGGGQPGARGFPDSRHTPGPGIAKGEAFSPLARRRSPEVNPIASACQAEPDQADSEIRNPKSEIRNPDTITKNMTGHAVNVGLRPTQPNLLQIASAQRPARLSGWLAQAVRRGAAAPTARRCRPQSASRARHRPPQPVICHFIDHGLGSGGPAVYHRPPLHRSLWLTGLAL